MTSYVDILDELDWLKDELDCINLIMKEGTYKDYNRNPHEVMFHNAEERITRVQKMIRECDETQGLLRCKNGIAKLKCNGEEYEVDIGFPKCQEVEDD